MEDKAPITLERIYEAPLKLVWKALTDKAELKKWYFDFSAGYAPEVGREFDWYAGPPGGKVWHHHGKIREVTEGEKLSHSWEFPGYPGFSIVTWKLIAMDANTTKLIFTHEFIEPFEPKEEALNRKNFVEGWNHIINTGLTEYLKGSQA